MTYPMWIGPMNWMPSEHRVTARIDDHAAAQAIARFVDLVHDGAAMRVSDPI
jgi:hypothetical protein